MEIEEETRRYYEARAPWHDGCMGYSSNASMEALLDPLIEFFEPFIVDRDVLEIACGTGNWTQILARRARSVTATDVNESMISVARAKPYGNGDVTFRVADAYSLEGIEGEYSAAFAGDWLSHVPKSRVHSFLELLQSKLRVDSRVVFIGMLRRDHPDLTPYRRDVGGNLIVRWRLPNEAVFDILCNFPSREELLHYARGLGEDVIYFEHRSLARWVLAYRTIRQAAATERAEESPRTS